MAATATVIGVVVVVTAVGVVATPAPAHADWVRDEQWQLSELDAADAWRYATGDGVTVAVLDSGVDADQPDLRGQVLPGADLVDGATDGRVDHVGHGTTVAALIAGRADDGDGVTGLAPGAKILPVRVLDDKNKYDDAGVVARGVRWAVDHGASIVNLSLGGTLRSEPLAQAVAYAAARNVIVVACTGNQDSSGAGSAPGTGAGSGPAEQVWYPAREPGVIAVAGLAAAEPAGARDGVGSPAPGRPATGSGGQGEPGGSGGGQRLWAGSITGPETVLTAPATNLLGAKPGGYWWVQGTSFATPLVAATAALVRSRWPLLSAAAVINRLVRGARDLGPAGRDDQYGFGEVDPVAALTAPIPDAEVNPLTEGYPILAGSQIGTGARTHARRQTATAGPGDVAAVAQPGAAGLGDGQRPAAGYVRRRLLLVGTTAAVLLTALIVVALRRRPV